MSGGLCVAYLLDLISPVLTKSGRATLVHFVPSTDFGFIPQPQEGCDDFFPFKRKGLGMHGLIHTWPSLKLPVQPHFGD